MIFFAVISVAIARAAIDRGGVLVQSHHQQDANGNYDFGYLLSDGQHREETQRFRELGPELGLNDVKGLYEFHGPDNVHYKVEYTANQDGYNPVITKS